MRILVVCEPGSFVLVAEGGVISPVFPGPQVTTGNPYILFGPAIRDFTGRSQFDATVTVATVTSGSLAAMGELRYAEPAGVDEFSFRKDW